MVHLSSEDIHTVYVSQLAICFTVSQIFTLNILESLLTLLLQIQCDICDRRYHMQRVQEPNPMMPYSCAACQSPAFTLLVFKFLLS